MPGAEISEQPERVEAILAIGDLADGLPFPALSEAATGLLAIVPPCQAKQAELGRICLGGEPAPVRRER